MPSFDEAENSQQTDLFLRGVIVLLAALIVFVALRSTPSEFRAHIVRVEGAMGPYREAGPDLLSPVASVEGVYAKLEGCDAALTALLTLLQPKDQRQKVAQDCLAFSTTVLQQSPAMSLAHLVQAIALVELGDEVAARQSLLLSSFTTGDSIANAQRRAALWAKRFDTLSGEEMAALGKDFERMANDGIGLTWLAGQYSENAAIRPLIVQVMQTMGEEQQGKFLRIVRRMQP